MKKMTCLIITLFVVNVFCFAQDDMFQDDISFENEPFNQEEIEFQKKEELNENLILLEKQLKQDKDTLQKQIEKEEDRVKRTNLEIKLKVKELEYQIKKDTFAFVEISNEMSVQQVLPETKKLKEHLVQFLEKYEQLLNEQSFQDIEHKHISAEENEILQSMEKTLNPIVDKLKMCQNGRFYDQNKSKAKILSIGKINKDKNYFTIKIIYEDDNTLMPTLKYDFSDIGLEQVNSMLKTSKKFIVEPLFSITQNNGGSFRKLLTAFSVKYLDNNFEKIIDLNVEVKDYSEVIRYNEMLK